MSTTYPTRTTTTDAPTNEPTNDSTVTDTLVAEDLIEEVSIDGMCGVY